MKTIIYVAFASSIAFYSCAENNGKTNDTGAGHKDSVAPVVAVNNASTNPVTTNEIITAYLKVKNALANDQGKNAAEAAHGMQSTLQNMPTGTLTPDQKKVYEDVKDDLEEHAEHIASNGTNIAHQREHFDMMSQDMIDLVKVTGSNQTLYRDHCPMYNKNKGASWLSETKDINNPYLGKEMPTCGEVKEEIRPKG